MNSTNSNNYYTPELEEFHIGFRYERCTKIELCNVKGHEINEVTWEKREGLAYNDFEWYKKLHRVKYLDQADIEELGWEDGNKYGLDNSFVFNWKDPNNNFQMYIYDNQYIEIYDWDAKYIFRGKLKNFNELQKLMKQLGI